MLLLLAVRSQTFHAALTASAFGYQHPFQTFGGYQCGPKAAWKGAEL